MNGPISHTAFETRLVDEHRGPAARRRLPRAAARLRVDDRRPSTTRACRSEERAGLDCIRGALGSLDELAPVDGIDVDDTAPSPAAESPVVAALRRATYEAYGEAAAAVEVGGETIDRLSAFSRLATADDPAERRARVRGDGPDVAGGRWRRRRRPVPIRVSSRPRAERWARDGSTDRGERGGPRDRARDASSRCSTRSWPWPAGPRRRGRPSPGHAGGAVGLPVRGRRGGAPAPERRPARAPAADQRRPPALAGRRSGRAGDRLRRRAAPGRPHHPGRLHDRRPAPGRGCSRPTTEGGLGNLAELLHESGHALHYAAIRTRPAFIEPPADHAAFFEAIAELLGWDVHEPAFQARHLGVAVEPRAGGARSLRRRPARRLLGALRDRAPPLARAATQRRLGRGGRRRPRASSRTRNGRGGPSAASSSTARATSRTTCSSAIAAAALRARIREVRGRLVDRRPGLVRVRVRAAVAVRRRRASRPT